MPKTKTMQIQLDLPLDNDTNDSIKKKTNTASPTEKKVILKFSRPNIEKKMSHSQKCLSVYKIFLQDPIT